MSARRDFYVALRRLVKLMGRRRSTLTVRQIFVLLSCPFTSPKLIGTEFGDRDGGSVSTTIADLISDGLMTGTPIPGKQRGHTYDITPAGAAIFNLSGEPANEAKP